MRKGLAIALAAAMGVSGVLTGVTPTQAAAIGVAPAAVERAAERASNVETVGQRRWHRGRHWRGGRHWHRGRHWYPRRYYGRHYYDHDDDDIGAAVAAGILGLAAGAIFSGALNSGGTSNWHAYCANKYRSYDPASGTYLGYDGLRHRCR